MRLKLNQSLRPVFSRRGLTLALFAGMLGLPPWVDAAVSRSSAESDALGESPIGTAGSVPLSVDRNPAESPGLAEPPAIDAAPSTGAALDPGHSDSGFDALPEVRFYSRNQQRTLQCRLYSSSGAIDELAAQRLDDFLADVRDPKQPKVGPIDRRLLQLVFRVAYHFRARQINVLSAYREQTKRREGLHALGRALDFSIPDVKTQVLASYLRTLPKVGVGVYTHRRTRFVHLDVRDQSYHWLDASPPGRTWRGVSIGNRSLVARDRNYDPKDDLPEEVSGPTRSK